MYVPTPIHYSKHCFSARGWPLGTTASTHYKSGGNGALMMRFYKESVTPAIRMQRRKCGLTHKDKGLILFDRCPSHLEIPLVNIQIHILGERWRAYTYVPTYERTYVCWSVIIPTSSYIRTYAYERDTHARIYVRT